MRLPRMRLTVRRTMVAVAVMAVAAWLWVCFYAEIDPYEAMVYFFAGSCFLLTGSGIFALIFLAMLMNPSDPPPRSDRGSWSTSERYPQFRIRSLMIAIAVVAVALALILLISRVSVR